MVDLAAKNLEADLPIQELEINLESLMTQPDKVIAALAEYISAVQNKKPLLADRFCKCSQFPLAETVKTFLEMKPFADAFKLAREIAKMIFENLIQQARESGRDAVDETLVA